MNVVSQRDAISYQPGSNASDIIINLLHFNLTALNYWNYTLYGNATLSNRSSCYLTFTPYTPAYIFPNGSFTNATSCFSPVKPIETRGIISLFLGTLYTASVLFTLIHLRKHGKSYLPREKRWSPVGRRTQWYWMLFVAACGAMSTFPAVDVDRDYLQSTALLLQSFFYTLMLPGLLACVWEAVRNWQVHSPPQKNSYRAPGKNDKPTTLTPFALRPNSARALTEFYLPLVFYALDWLVFFMLIPRPWTPLQMQRSAAQTSSIAQPASTDARFKAGAVLALLSWCVICYSLGHSLFHYKLSHPTPLNSTFALMTHAPAKLMLTISLLALHLSYAIASSFLWSISPYSITTSLGWIFGLGYTPPLLIVIVFNIYGYVDANEDKLLIAQRTRRGESADAELRALRKPGWWAKSNLKSSRRPGVEGDAWNSNPSAAAVRGSRVEDDEDADGYWWWQRRKEEEAESRRNAGSSSASSSRHILGSSMLAQGESEPVSQRASSLRSGSSRESRLQVVRSMLDV